MLSLPQERPNISPAGRGSDEVKIIWGKDKKSVVIIAESFYEVAMAEIFLEGMNYSRYATTKKGTRIIAAKYSIIPEENKP